MPKIDLILLHAPSVYDFRRKTILYGPISDLIPSSPIFEMYPIGFASIAEYLERYGYKVRIVNLAVRMLNDNRFNAEEMIKRLEAPVFGIDLHWLVHAHGAIEVARLVKRHHPQAKLVVGGLSATYFYRELLQYPEIDYVLRGDSIEEPFRLLMNCLKSASEEAVVPNLAWRDVDGQPRETPLSYVPTHLNGVMVHHYDSIVRSVIRHRGFSNYIPFKRWLRYPITAVLTCRGCTQNCVICGGSAAAFRRVCNRQRPAFRSPEQAAEDVRGIRMFSNAPIFILGDIRQPGEAYANQLLALLEKDKVRNQLIFELFEPAPKNLLQKIGKTSPGFCLEISPESHDPAVREASGKHYSNEALEDTISYALQSGCQRVDIFFMVGLPRQTPQSVMNTIDYCNYLMDRFGKYKRLYLGISPLAPFLDPGSLAFEYPQRYGYQLLFRTLEEHRQALIAPSWKYMLNYETEWMNRSQIAETTLEAGLRLNHLKAKHGLIANGRAKATERRIAIAMETMHHIDKIIAEGRNPDQDKQLRYLKNISDDVSGSTMCHKEELELPGPLIKFKLMPALRLFLMKTVMSTNSISRVVGCRTFMARILGR